MQFLFSLSMSLWSWLKTGSKRPAAKTPLLPKPVDDAEQSAAAEIDAAALEKSQAGATGKRRSTAIMTMSCGQKWQSTPACMDNGVLPVFHEGTWEKCVTQHHRIHREEVPGTPHPYTGRSKLQERGTWSTLTSSWRCGWPCAVLREGD